MLGIYLLWSMGNNILCIFGLKIINIMKIFNAHNYKEHKDHHKYYTQIELVNTFVNFQFSPMHICK